MGINQFEVHADKYEMVRFHAKKHQNAGNIPTPLIMGAGGMGACLARETPLVNSRNTGIHPLVNSASRNTCILHLLLPVKGQKG